MTSKKTKAKTPLLCTTSLIIALSLAVPVSAQSTPTGVEATPEETGVVGAADGGTGVNEPAVAGEIVVTATRSSQVISRVPLSISAFSQEKMDSQGVKQFTDVVRLTPGLTFEPGRIRSQVAIRGVSSNAGAATTGIYIDDTPIQVRTLGVSSSNTYPTIFDLERVEVLRGPQGTLFGAGSEGGTIRFIQPGPNYNSWSAYGRGEVATTESGGTSYEAGLAIGGPIIEDKIAFRASVFHRVDGGWIDKVIGTPRVISSTGALGTGSVAFDTTGTYSENSNWARVTVLRGALGFQPTENLTVTTSISYQKQFEHDRIFAFWPGISDPSASDYRVPVWIPASVADANHSYIPVDGVNGRPGSFTSEPFHDKFILPSLKVELDLGMANVISNLSYFDRDQTQISDYTLTHVNAYPRRQLPNPGDAGFSQNANSQKNWTQELRIQSSPEFSQRIKLIAGGFYQHSDQYNRQISYNNFIDRSPSIAVAAVNGFPTPAPAVNNGAPFGPGYSAFVNYYGVPLIDGIYQYDVTLKTVDKQIAAFGQADWEVLDGLTLTVGMRYSKNKNELDPTYLGPITNLNTPQGRACVPGTGIPGGAPCIAVPVGAFTPGTGPFTPAYINEAVKSKDKAFTPKFGVAYQMDPRNLFYTTVAKGFRPGGAQQRQPSNCDAQLTALGYVDETGRPLPPTSFDSDSVWSYEIGSKNRLFGGKISIDASAYYVDWKNIQSTVSLSSCLQSLFDNLGKASSKGFDLVVQARPLDDLLLSASVGYNKSVFEEAVVLGGRTNYTKGSPLPNSGAPWTVVLSGEYERDVMDRLRGYFRYDYTYQSKLKPTGNNDPGTVSYDRLLRVRGETHLLNARLGTRFEKVDVSLFVNNVLNSHPSLNYTRSAGQPLFTDYTFRPRTIGLTGFFRY